ncbi:hypothetical protein [Labedaea rhizosphaerae]|uniref:hypothetical protein n=1 Tax=Labedaea rhizosphaerae TaxID=598644 RepID=UPI001AAD18DE|nr:hypothetical protein [Labedaea rhizosphaerae]
MTKPILIGPEPPPLSPPELRVVVHAPAIITAASTANRGMSLAERAIVAAFLARPRLDAAWCSSP